MTIQIHSNINNLLVNAVKSLLGTHAITVYSGSQPTPATVISSWASYNSTNVVFLAHYESAIWTMPSEGNLIQLTTVPAAVAASHTGSASWAILWCANTALGSMGSTIPINRFMIVPVTLSGGTGTIRFSDLSFVQTVSKGIQSGSLQSTLV